MGESNATIKYTIRKLPEFKDVSESTIKAIINVNCAAFKGDLYTKIILGGHLDLAPCMERAFLIDSLKSGHVYVAELEDGTIVGNALWHRRGDPPVGTPLTKKLLLGENANEEGFHKFFSALEQRDSGLAKWWNGYFQEKFSSFTQECLATYGNKEAVWQLYSVGILPEYQRYGIGTAFVKAIEDQITNNPNSDPADRKISLVADMDVARKFYHKLGFVIRGETIIEGYGDLGTCPLWHFVKDV
ncbi:hypothetical protein SCHPADRAFT_896287 [Schizopora paradoxa]|uniref:N-acetyltransferase domain-containing protein n=1 Tax=Schizopora paradoxa TaxID=27342 RepID=A0A0H2R0X4_9AGAM|nr:hypothetical protein SCHPADRAFT_896287 [Schizopora paradoxa]